MDISEPKSQFTCTGRRRGLFVSLIRGPWALCLCGLVIFVVVVEVEVVIGGVLLFVHMYIRP
jgi:hypothetical protein